MNPQILAALIGAAALIALALAGVIWQMGRLVGRIDTQETLAFERKKEVDRWRREHLNRHNTEATWWEKVYAHYDSHVHAPGGD